MEIKLINFELKHIKCNHEKKKKMERMRKKNKFVLEHPLTETSGYVIYLFNIRS